MLSENIKNYRKSANMSQEELAMQLHIVRQTLSKWENALSVPDADQLISLAKVLHVGVNDLLGTDIKDPGDIKELAKALADANEEIARYAEKERLHQEAGKVRGTIIWITLIGIVLMHMIRNDTAAIILSAIVGISVLLILYKNLTLLSIDFNGSDTSNSIRFITIFNILLIAVIATAAILLKTGVFHLSENQEELFAAGIISAVILITGTIAPRIPYNRHTGLRLPWTIANKRAWNIAHQTLGIISVPLSLIYISLVFFTGNMETVTIMTVALWIGIPGIISLVSFYR